MDLIRKIFWTAVFLFLTLCFVVLFEKGPNNFASNVQKQVSEFTDFVVKTFQDQTKALKKDK